MPHLPRLHLADGRRSGTKIRRYNTQVIEIQYVNMIATICREMMALKAAVEPRLINASRALMAQDRITALTGMSLVG